MNWLRIWELGVVACLENMIHTFPFICKRICPSRFLRGAWVATASLYHSCPQNCLFQSCNLVTILFLAFYMKNRLWFTIKLSKHYSYIPTTYNNILLLSWSENYIRCYTYIYEYGYFYTELITLCSNLIFHLSFPCFGFHNNRPIYCLDACRFFPLLCSTEVPQVNQVCWKHPFVNIFL